MAAAGRRRPSTFALVGATGKGNVRGRRDGAREGHARSQADVTTRTHPRDGGFVALRGDLERRGIAAHDGGDGVVALLGPVDAGAVPRPGRIWSWAASSRLQEGPAAHRSDAGTSAGRRAGRRNNTMTQATRPSDRGRQLVYLRSTSTIPPTFFRSVSLESARIMTERHLGPSFRGALIEFILTVGPVTGLLKVQLLHSRPERASELLGHVDHPLNVLVPPGAVI